MGTQSEQPFQETEYQAKRKQPFHESSVWSSRRSKIGCGKPT